MFDRKTISMANFNSYVKLPEDIQIPKLLQRNVQQIDTEVTAKSQFCRVLAMLSGLMVWLGARFLGSWSLLSGFEKTIHCGRDMTANGLEFPSFYIHIAGTLRCHQTWLGNPMFQWRFRENHPQRPWTFQQTMFDCWREISLWSSIFFRTKKGAPKWRKAALNHGC